MFWMKVHQTDDGKLVAACDEDLIGQKFTEGKKCLKIAEDFYKGEKVELLTILDEIKDAATTNFVGHQLIEQLLDSDILQDDEVDEIDGMVHSHMYFI